MIKLIKKYQVAVLLMCFTFNNVASAKDTNQQLIWNRLVGNFQICNNTQSNLVTLYINKYSANKYHVTKLAVRSSPYLYHIITELEKRNLPAELALLPMIESSYEPFAISNKGAVGLWQISHITGKRYGLVQEHWYDGRRDIEDSTTAALDYLEFLYKKFNGNWLLALAAYNAGEGRIGKAIKNNQNTGKADDYWSLKLPAQTKHFVPKILALAHIIKHADRFKLKLPKVYNIPFFTKIYSKERIDLYVVSKLAGIEFKQLQALNPGYKRSITTIKNNQHQVLLPAKQIAIFNKNLIEAYKDKKLSKKIHTNK